MHYRVVVYRGPLSQVPPTEAGDIVVDRQFEFFESSHKVQDVLSMAVDQLIAEGGQDD